jgi:membrane associated rhomboid family serine protease
MIYMQVDVPMERLPWANWALMAVTTVVSIAVMVQDAKVEQTVGPQVMFNPDLEKQLANPRLTEQQKQALFDRELDRMAASVRELPTDRLALHLIGPDFHVWQLVTYLFVHGGVLHLFGNMLFLFCFGNAIDAKLGHPLFLGLYLALGILAGLAWLVLGSGPVIGASGAIMGITGVFLVLYPVNEVTVWDLLWMRLTGDALRLPSWVFIVFYMALDLYGTLSRDQGVAYIAHLGGELAGIGIASALILTGRIQSGRGENNLLELMGWVETQPRPRRRRKRPKPKLPPPASAGDVE